MVRESIARGGVLQLGRQADSSLFPRFSSVVIALPFAARHRTLYLPPLLARRSSQANLSSSPARPRPSNINSSSSTRP